jgi:RNA recognition motif-containing protein
MSTKLLIGNVPVEMTETCLQEFLTPFGTIKALNMPKTLHGRVKGFAFVEMSSRSEAVAAQTALTNSQFNGRKLTVTLKEEVAIPRSRLLTFLKLFKT